MSWSFLFPTSVVRLRILRTKFSPQRLYWILTVKTCGSPAFPRSILVWDSISETCNRVSCSAWSGFVLCTYEEVSQFIFSARILLFARCHSCEHTRFPLFVSVPQQVSLYLLWSVTLWGQSSDARIVNFTKTGSSGPFWCGVRKCVVRVGEIQDALGLLTCERTLDGQACGGCDSMGSPRRPRRRSGSAGCCGKCDASGGSTCGDVARAVDLFCKDAKFDKWCSKITLSRTREKCCVCECDCGRCTVYNNNYNLKQLEQSKQPRANWKNRAQNEASWKTNNNKKHRQT